MRRVRSLPTPQRILHAIKVAAHRIQIFGRKEGSFFEMVEEALDVVNSNESPLKSDARTNLNGRSHGISRKYSKIVTRHDPCADCGLTQRVPHCYGQL